MEYVPGVPITRFCDDARLPIRARLELFLKVCDAIAHAHTKAIIHRDIKAGNVLAYVTDGKPTVKVIDFGIAKALTGDRLTDLTFNTNRGSIVGTFEAMSPEQANGSPDIDIRADVYALGVLLYELLVGFKPFDTPEFPSFGNRLCRSSAGCCARTLS
jgi:serine/threonine protein kinase